MDQIGSVITSGNNARTEFDWTTATWLIMLGFRPQRARIQVRGRIPGHAKTQVAGNPRPARFTDTSRADSQSGRSLQSSTEFEPDRIYGDAKEITAAGAAPRERPLRTHLTDRQSSSAICPGRFRIPPHGRDAESAERPPGGIETRRQPSNSPELALPWCRSAVRQAWSWNIRLCSVQSR